MTKVQAPMTKEDEKTAKNAKGGDMTQSRPRHWDRVPGYQEGKSQPRINTDKHGWRK